MQHQTTLVYTEPLLRRPLRGALAASGWGRFLVAILLTAIALIGLLWRGDRSSLKRLPAEARSIAHLNATHLRAMAI